MGTEKPDDNKGKGKSILESNDPINPIAKEKPPPSSTPPGQQSSSAQVPPLPPFGHSKIPRGTGIQIGESFFFSPLITNQIPLAAQQHNLLRTHQTGDYQQHQGQVGHVRCPTPSLIRDFLASQGFPSAIPQSSNILGQPSAPRKRGRDESSPPVGSSPPVVLQGDSSQPLQPSGNKCMLCMKVLNEQLGMHTCGHFFHDECLQKILHAWHSKNHPCIQCLINAWLSILECHT